MSDRVDIVIEPSDLHSPEIEERIHMDRSLEDMARASRSIIRTPILRSPLFFYSFAGLTGAFGGWIANEYLNQHSPISTVASALDGTRYLLIAAGIGLMIGMLFGLIHRNIRQVLVGGLFGMLVGMAVTVVTGGLAQGTLWLMTDVPQWLSRGKTGIPSLNPAEGIGFFLSICGHGSAWSLVLLAAGLGPGLGLKSKQIRFNGWCGGAIGGVVGGMLIPVLERFLPGSGALRDAIIFSQVGIWVGLCFALMEFATRDSWLILAKGWLRGKRIVLHKPILVLGSAMGCDVYLTGDPAIEPSHALLTKEGVRWLIRDNETEEGTFVNGHKISQCLLNNDDVVTIGQMVLKFKQHRHQA